MIGANPIPHNRMKMRFYPSKQREVSLWEDIIFTVQNAVPKRFFMDPFHPELLQTLEMDMVLQYTTTNALNVITWMQGICGLDWER